MANKRQLRQVARQRCRYSVCFQIEVINWTKARVPLIMDCDKRGWSSQLCESRCRCLFFCLLSCSMHAWILLLNCILWKICDLFFGLFGGDIALNVCVSYPKVFSLHVCSIECKSNINVRTWDEQPSIRYYIFNYIPPLYRRIVLSVVKPFTDLLICYDPRVLAVCIASAIVTATQVKSRSTVTT